jgi:hypothetical protein
VQWGEVETEIRSQYPHLMLIHSRGDIVIRTMLVSGLCICMKIKETGEMSSWCMNFAT